MHTPSMPALRATHLAFMFALTPAASGIALAGNAASTVDPRAAAKTHVLFMGADLALEKDKGVHPVVDVTPNFLVIKPGDQPLKVPLADTVALVIHESLKIAETSVVVDRLKFDRAYSPAADPMARLAKTAALAAGQSATADIASGSALNASMQVVVANSMVANASNPIALADAQKVLGQAEANQAAADQALSRALGTPMSEIYDVGAQSVNAVGEETYDAIRVSFDVKSEKNLPHAYCGIIAQIRERGSKPSQARKWAYVRSLGAIGAGETVQVNVLQSGFSPGYILESCEVHLYNAGAELATNLSRKRVPLTDDEALQYRIIEYVAANKGRTLPAAPLTARLAADVRTRLVPGQLSETYYVRVMKDGSVSQAFRDRTGKQPVDDAALESVLKTIRFKPALDAGKPTESIAPFKLGQLSSI